MNDIVYTVKKSASARIFVMVALSLAMAVLVGAGWHAAPISSNSDKAGMRPVSSSSTGAGASLSVNSAASKEVMTSSLSTTDTVAKTSSFDRAMRSMASLDRSQHNQAASTEVKSAPAPAPAQGTDASGVSKAATNASQPVTEATPRR